MRRLARVVFAFACALAGAAVAPAQFGRAAGDWMTSGNDAQRSSWVRTDPKISSDSMQKPGFQVLWKIQLGNDREPSNALTAPVLLERYIGYRGFRSLGFAGGNSNGVFGVDTDLGRLEWQRRLSPAAAAPGGSLP